jgi:hypothetical protein
MTLKYDPEKRPSTEELMEHNFIKKSERKKTRGKRYLSQMIDKYIRREK